jgi:hypothetical protein
MRLPCAWARTPIPIRDKPQNLTGRKQAEDFMVLARVPRRARTLIRGSWVSEQWSEFDRLGASPTRGRPALKA